jgi:hypothetical protein
MFGCAASRYLLSVYLCFIHISAQLLAVLYPCIYRCLAVLHSRIYKYLAVPYPSIYNYLAVLYPRIESYLTVIYPCLYSSLVVLHPCIKSCQVVLLSCIYDCLVVLFTCIVKGLPDRSTARYFYKGSKTSLHKHTGNLVENLFSKICALKNYLQLLT